MMAGIVIRVAPDLRPKPPERSLDPARNPLRSIAAAKPVPALKHDLTLAILRLVRRDRLRESRPSAFVITLLPYVR